MVATELNGAYMRRYMTFFAVLLSAASLQAQADLPIHSRTLANGLEVIVIENHAVPIVTVELDVKNGGFTQTPELEGLAHLYEHMFFKANKTIPSQEKYLQRIRQLGASWNGSTRVERVNYFVTVGVDSLRAGDAVHGGRDPVSALQPGRARTGAARCARRIRPQ